MLCWFRRYYWLGQMCRQRYVGRLICTGIHMISPLLVFQSFANIAVATGSPQYGTAVISSGNQSPHFQHVRDYRYINLSAGLQSSTTVRQVIDEYRINQNIDQKTDAELLTAFLLQRDFMLPSILFMMVAGTTGRLLDRRGKPVPMSNTFLPG